MFTDFCKTIERAITVLHFTTAHACAMFYIHEKFILLINAILANNQPLFGLTLVAAASAYLGVKYLTRTAYHLQERLQKEKIKKVAVIMLRHFVPVQLIVWIMHVESQKFESCLLRYHTGTTSFSRSLLN